MSELGPAGAQEIASLAPRRNECLEQRWRHGDRSHGSAQTAPETETVYPSRRLIDGGATGGRPLGRRLLRQVSRRRRQICDVTGRHCWYGWPLPPPAWCWLAGLLSGGVTLSRPASARPAGTAGARSVAHRWAGSASSPDAVAAMSGRVRPVPAAAFTAPPARCFPASRDAFLSGKQPAFRSR